MMISRGFKSPCEATYQFGLQLINVSFAKDNLTLLFCCSSRSTPVSITPYLTTSSSSSSSSYRLFFSAASSSYTVVDHTYAAVVVGAGGCRRVRAAGWGTAWTSRAAVWGCCASSVVVGRWRGTGSDRELSFFSLMPSPTTISSNLPSLQWKPSLLTTFSLQFKPFSLYTSFKTPKDSNFKLPLIKKVPPLQRSDLPVIVKRNGKNYKYFWDGNSLELLCVDCVDSLSFIQGFEDGVQSFIKGVRDFFIPKQVTDNYIVYVKCKFLHRVFSSALQVLATQAMFRAIGVGYAQSLPSAAAMNWVLKDGLGRLCRCIYTACVGSAFDTNLKRVRFATSIMFSLSIGIELMTPAFPHCFLLLASVANIAKQISLACYLATGTAVHRSFALADNMGEVSAKAQIQTVCFDNLGLLLAASLNIMLKNKERLQAGLPFVVYPIFTAIDLCAIYQSLKHVHLQTLTKERLELIIDKWIQCGYVPSPAEVSKLEGINLVEFSGRDKRKWPIRIGCLNPKRQIPLLTMLTMNSLSGDDFYFICLETSCGSRTGKCGILLSLREDAGTEDIIMGLLQACYVRCALLSNVCEWANISHSQAMRCFELTKESKILAQLDISKFQEQLLNSSWATKNILLGTQEQARYSFVGEIDD